MKFVLIPPGEFTMGSSPQEIEEAFKIWSDYGDTHEKVKSEGPQHKVILTQAIYLGIHEVTQKEYAAVMGTNPSHFSSTGAGKETVANLDTQNHPVELVSWNDAAEFCAKLSQKDDLKPFYFRAGESVTPMNGTGYRLPTEGEWEFSCRAGTTTKFWIGDEDNDLPRIGWFGGNSGGRTHAVAELLGNPFGLYDIHGNVFEWAQDSWEPKYYGQFRDQPAVDPNGSPLPGSARIFRGWAPNAGLCRSAMRYWYSPSASMNVLGFRVALPADAVRQTLKVTGPAMANRPKALVTDGSTASTAKPLTPLPQLELDESDPLPAWELPAGAPLPVVAPCEPTLATERQQLWAEFLKRPVVEEISDNAGLGMKFALIPPGEFRKIFTRPRDPAIEPDMPVRRFRITKPYAISTTEVTWDQFRQFVEATGYQTEAETNGLGGRDREFKADPKINWRTPGWKPAPNEPVTQVTPRDAEAFCAWLTDPVGWASSPSVPHVHAQPKDEKGGQGEEKKDGLEAHPTYRLPTEAEWVHACRAGSVHKHVVGPEPKDLDYFAWSKGSPQATNTGTALHPVGIMKPNPFGLYDTLGNVWERTIDLLNGPGSLAPYLATNDPRGMPGANLAGGSYLDVASTVHPDFVMASHPEPGTNVGFRVLKQFDGAPLPGPLDRPLVLRAGQPLSVHALVPRPEKIPGLQSWSIELAGMHESFVIAIAASPKGDLIATGSQFGKISLWDRDGNYQRALLGHEAGVSSLDFSRDGRWLASCELGGGERGFGGITARVWNVETGALHAVIPLPGWGNRIAFSPSGEQLAVSIEYFGTFLVFDLVTGGVRTPVIKGNTVRGIAWSPDGTELACSHGDNHLRIWDAKTLQVLRDIEAPASQSLEWSPDSKWLAALTADGKIAIRDAQTLQVTQTFASDRNSMAQPAFAWLPDSQRIVAGEQGVFAATTGERLAKFELSGGAGCVAVIDEGQEAVFEAYGRLHFYDTSTGQKLREGKERGGTGDGTMLAPNGNQVLAPRGRNVWMFDATTGQRLRDFAFSHQFPHGNFSVQPSPDSSLCAISAPVGGDPVLVIVDSMTGATRHELSHGQGNVTRVAWSPDGKWLATGATDKLVRVWNVATGKIEHELAGHTGTIWSLAWSPDGTRLASAAEDKTVRLWNPLAGKLVATYDQFPEAKLTGGWQQQAFAWTTDSRRLWIALGQNIVPLDVETGTFGPMENFSNGNVVTFLNTSPDGQRLLAGNLYGWTFVRGRDAQDRRLLGQHLGQTAQWHPDSRRFLGWDGAYGTVGFDVETNRRLGILFPWLTGDHWLCLGPTGHYRGSPGASDQIVYVAMLPDGSQRTYTPADFAETFGWKNDPEKAELLGK